MSNKYSFTNRVTLQINKNDGSVDISNNQHCLEKIKKDYLKTESIKISLESNKILQVFPQDIIDKWLAVLKNNFHLKFEYEIKDDYHSFTINYKDYNNILEVYIVMVLIRYLFYAENNELIYTIFDIKEKTERKFDYSVCLSLAHYYKQYDNTFNLFDCELPIKVNINFEHLFLISPYGNNLHEQYQKYLIISSVEKNKGFYKYFQNKLKQKLTRNYLEDYELITKYISIIQSNHISNQTIINQFQALHNLLEPDVKIEVIHFNKENAKNNDTIIYFKNGYNERSIAKILDNGALTGYGELSFDPNLREEGYYIILRKL